MMFHIKTYFMQIMQMQIAVLILSNLATSECNMKDLMKMKAPLVLPTERMGNVNSPCKHQSQFQVKQID